VVHQSLTFGRRAPDDGTLPRVKVDADAVHGKLLRSEQAPARHKSTMAGATRTAMVPRRGGSFPTLANPAPTGPTKGSRAAGDWPRAAGTRHPRDIAGARLTMKQTARDRKRIMEGRP
jgi:hypothetical protein